jgi:nucleotide-binding universal stress UspA family protein
VNDEIGDVAMITTLEPDVLAPSRVHASGAAPIVVATDGRMQSDAALVAGRLLAGRAEAMRLVTVLKPLPAIPQGGQLAITPDIEAARRAGMRRGVIAQRQRLIDAPVPVELAEGDPATVIADLAHRTGATMIVAGLGRHRVTDRIFGDETALRLIRASDVPVLAVADSESAAPRRILVACDFSEASMRAARVVLDMAAPGAVVHLTHVAPRDSAFYDMADWSETYKRDSAAALERASEELHVPDGVSLETTLLQGDAATELLAFASTIGADLIATGRHGYGTMTRLLVGSVTTRIVRCAACSVLVAPYITLDAQIERDAQRTRFQAILDGGAENARRAGRIPRRILES